MSERLVLAELLADTRPQGDTIPTDDELFAFVRGELSDDDVVRIRRRLVTDPEQRERLREIRAFVEAEGRLQDPPADLAAFRAWGDLQARITAPPKRQVRSWGLLAATLAAALGVLFLLPRAFPPETAPVRVLTTVELVDGARSSPPTVEGGSERDVQVVLTVPSPPEDCGGELRLEVESPAGSAVLEGLALDPSGRLALVLQGRPGRSTLTLHGCGDRPRTFRLDVLEPAPP